MLARGCQCGALWGSKMQSCFRPLPEESCFPKCGPGERLSTFGVIREWCACEGDYRSGMTAIEIREATVPDAWGVADVHVRSWQNAYRGLIADDVLSSLSVEQRAVRWAGWISASLAGEATDGRGVVSDGASSHRMVVASSGDRIVGWATFGPGRDADSDSLGELAGLYVDPAFWAQRIGFALISRVESELRAAGFDAAYLWVLDGNKRASRFYTRQGWQADGVEKLGEAGGLTGLHEWRHVKRLAPSALAVARNGAD